MPSITEVFTLLLELLVDILRIFTVSKQYIETAINNLDTLDTISLVRPYVANIRYVVGDNIYRLTFQALLFYIAINVIKASYKLVTDITRSDLINRPTKIFNKVFK